MQWFIIDTYELRTKLLLFILISEENPYKIALLIYAEKVTIALCVHEAFNWWTLYHLRDSRICSKSIGDTYIYNYM